MKNVPGYLMSDVELQNGKIVPVGFDKKKINKGLMGIEKVPDDEQTAEMRQFAEENDAEWIYLNGHPVCVDISAGTA